MGGDSLLLKNLLIIFRIAVPVVTPVATDTNEIDYLAHTINGIGVHMDKDKVQVVSNWPIPTTLK